MKGTRITRYLFIYIYIEAEQRLQIPQHIQSIYFHCARRILPEDTERGQEWKGKGERKGNRKWTARGEGKEWRRAMYKRNGG